MPQINFHCCDCMTLLKVDPRAAGQTVQCPQCRTALIVPAPEARLMPPPGPVLPAKPVEKPRPQRAQEPRSSISRQQYAFERPAFRRRSSTGLGILLIPIGLALGLAVIVGGVFLVTWLMYDPERNELQSGSDLRIEQTNFSYQRNGDTTVFTLSYRITSGSVHPKDRIVWRIEPSIIWLGEAGYNHDTLEATFSGAQFAAAGTLTHEVRIRLLNSSDLGPVDSSLSVVPGNSTSIGRSISNKVTFGGRSDPSRPNQPMMPANPGGPSQPAGEFFVNLSNARIESENSLGMDITVDYQTQGTPAASYIGSSYTWVIKSSLNSSAQLVSFREKGTLKVHVISFGIGDPDPGPFTMYIEKFGGQIVSNTVSVASSKPPSNRNPFGPQQGPPNMPPNNPFPGQPNMPPNRPPFGPPGGMRPPFRREP